MATLTLIKSPETCKSSSEIFTIDPIKFKISQNIKKSFDPKRFLIQEKCIQVFKCKQILQRIN